MVFKSFLRFEEWKREVGIDDILQMKIETFENFWIFVVMVDKD